LTQSVATKPCGSGAFFRASAIQAGWSMAGRQPHQHTSIGGRDKGPRRRLLKPLHTVVCGTMLATQIEICETLSGFRERNPGGCETGWKHRGALRSQGRSRARHGVLAVRVPADLGDLGVRPLRRGNHRPRSHGQIPVALGGNPYFRGFPIGQSALKPPWRA
jgi:hypothetical protein